MKKIAILLFISVSCLFAKAQNLNQSYVDYIESYKEIAISEMKEYGIPASITLAQGLLESGGGTSRLAKEANNHFGIKCNNTWTGATIYHDDDAKGECFRLYKHAIESYEDHSKFLAFRPRYAFLFEFAPNDYKAWAFGLKQAGYATNPNYPTRLIKIIEDYKLHVYDMAERVPRKTSTDAENATVKSTKKKPENETSESKDELKKKKSFFSFLHSKNPPKVEDPSKDKVFSDGTYIADITPFQSHTVQKINGVKYVVAQQGDTYASIAEEFELFEKELLKANEQKYGANPQTGDVVYLSKKKKRASKDFYTFAEGDTMYRVSQQFGIKQRSLYRLNGLVFGKQPASGTVLKLR